MVYVTEISFNFVSIQAYLGGGFRVPTSIGRPQVPPLSDSSQPLRSGFRLQVLIGGDICGPRAPRQRQDIPQEAIACVLGDEVLLYVWDLVSLNESDTDTKCD